MHFRSAQPIHRLDSHLHGSLRLVLALVFAGWLDGFYNMPLEACVYNVPMALDSQTSRTHGLEPALAMARGRAHIQDAQRYTLGPMPAATFMDTFLKSTSTDRDDLLSFENAFNTVPERADSAAEIYEPLVCSIHRN